MTRIDKLAMELYEIFRCDMRTQTFEGKQAYTKLRIISGNTLISYDVACKLAQFFPREIAQNPITALFCLEDYHQDLPGMSHYVKILLADPDTEI